MCTHLSSERGIALALSVFALVVIGGLVGAAFFLGMQEQRVGRNTVKFQQAFASAQEGAQLQVANWDPVTMNVLPTGDSVNYAGLLANGTGWYRGSVLRLNTEMFLVRTEGFSADSQTRQHVGLLLRLRPIEIDIQAALKTQGATQVGGNSLINGQDTQPPDATGCGPVEPTLPGMMITDEDDITYSGCNGCIQGDPDVLEDPTITSENLLQFGDATFDDLKALATKILPAGNYQGIGAVESGGVCDFGYDKNFGDPMNAGGACHNYYPMIFFEGEGASTTLNTGYGQGVLIVEGDLDVQGGFEFYGPVIVQGRLKTTGQGGHFNGGVIAANVELDPNVILGSAVINFSSCALARALTGSASAGLIAERSWVNLF